MKDKYYADNRDIVKWGGIVHLCTENKIKHVVQVAYYRIESWNDKKMKFDGESIDLPAKVIKHFRDIGKIKRLGSDMGIKIDVKKDEFSHDNRESYHIDLCKCIREMKDRKIIFLDPDIGLAPNVAKAGHVKPEEITKIWQSLKQKDFLVLYQHKFRKIKWINEKKEQFTKACNIDKNRVKQWSIDKLANDVVFFFIEK